jgi:hypothetical protein
MIVIGILLTLTLGIGIALAISTKFSLLEYLSLAFPLGIGTQAFLMTTLDWVNIPITAASTGLFSLIVLGICCLPMIRNFRNDPEFLDRLFPKGYRLPKPNLVWILFVGLIVWFEGMNFYKTVYFPTFDTDGVRGYNLAGIAISAEHTLKHLSLFTSPNFHLRSDAGLSSYAPLPELTYAYVYLFGAAASKMVNAILFLSFLGIFYAQLARTTTHTVAAICTFLMMITPEMLAFSALSGINVLHAVYACSGLLFAVLWFYQKKPELLVVSALLLAMNCLTRNEGIVFSATASALVLFRWIRKDIHWKKMLLFVGVAFFGFFFWMLYMKTNGIQSGGNLIITKLFWDSEKIDTMARELKTLYLNTDYYGIGVITFGLFLLLNLWNLIRKGDQAATAFAAVGVMLLYTLLIYHINFVWDSLENVLRFSYKRFLFSFIPLMWFYIGTNGIVRWVTEKADKMLYK